MRRHGDAARVQNRTQPQRSSVRSPDGGPGAAADAAVSAPFGRVRRRGPLGVQVDRDAVVVAGALQEFPSVGTRVPIRENRAKDGCVGEKREGAEHHRRVHREVRPARVQTVRREVGDVRVVSKRVERRHHHVVEHVVQRIVQRVHQRFSAEVIRRIRGDQNRRGGDEARHPDARHEHRRRQRVHPKPERALQVSHTEGNREQREGEPGPDSDRRDETEGAGDSPPVPPRPREGHERGDREEARLERVAERAHGEDQHGPRRGQRDSSIRPRRLTRSLHVTRFCPG